MLYPEAASCYGSKGDIYLYSGELDKAESVYYKLFNSEKSGVISAFIYLIPAFAILFGRMLLREPITLSLIGGGLMILAGITLVSREPKSTQGER